MSTLVLDGTGEEFILSVMNEKEIPIFKGEYRNGLRNGYGVELHPSGLSWVGEWLNNEEWFGSSYYEDKIKHVLIDGRRLN